MQQRAPARRCVAVAVIVAATAALVSRSGLAQAPSIDRAETAPTSRTFHPPGRTYRMPGADLPPVPTEAWASRSALEAFVVDVAKKLLPNDGGAFWIGAIVLLLVGGAFTPFRLGRNLELIVLLALAPFIAHLLWRQQRLDDTPSQRGAFVAAYTGVYALTAWWWLRGLVGALRARGDSWMPALPTRALAAGALLLVLLNVATAVLRTPDDCGHYTALGAQRMLEKRTWPYGDEKLVGGAAATYGPVLYLVHAGFLAPADDPTPNAPDALPDPNWGYRLPSPWVTKAATLFFHGVALLALWFIGRRAKGPAVGWALVALYAGSPYVIGLGGNGAWLTGMVYVSHIAPAAMTLLAFAALPRPFLCGVLLNLAVATGYFPAFFFPAWVAYFWTRPKPAAKPFLAGFFLMGAIVIAALWFGTHTEPGQNPMRLFLDGTIAHQEAPDQYGSSTLSFWYAHPELKRMLRTPLVEGVAMLTPMFLLAVGYSLLGFVLGRRRTPAQLAFLTASTIACVQLWKHHASGTYVEWYYPLLLIAIFANAPEPTRDPSPEPSPT